MAVIKEMIILRSMEADDYAEVRRLWMTIKGFKIRNIDDSEEYITAFLKRNPRLSCVATLEGKIIGSILCGHDGRQASFYHVCVAEKFRMHGIGEQMAGFCTDALKKEHISKISLVAFTSNEIGNRFWQKLGWISRGDVNCYDCILNEKNTMKIVK